MVAVSRTYRHTQNRSGNRRSLHLLFTAILCALSYYTGTRNASVPGSSSTVSTASNIASGSVLTATECERVKNEAVKEALRKQGEQNSVEEQERIEGLVENRVHDLIFDENGHQEEEENMQEQHQELQKLQQEQQTKSDPTPLFKRSQSAIVNGIARMSKDEFVKRFDYGPPMEKGDGTAAEDTIILYNTIKSIPTSNPDHSDAVQYGTNGGGDESFIQKLSTEEATENCDTMNVVTVGNPGNTKQCTVLVNNYENYHTQRWIRVKKELKGKIDHNEPLRSVGRGYTSKGAKTFVPPDDRSIKKHWKTLYTYLDTLDDVISKLSPIAKKVAKDNTIIVMTCNMGQSELLMNFVCGAKSRGFDLSNILVFPTDVETKDLAEGLGLATFYDEKVSNIYINLSRFVSFHRSFLLLSKTTHSNFHHLLYPFGYTSSTEFCGYASGRSTALWRQKFHCYDVC